MNVALQPDFQGPAENDHGRRGNAALFGMAFDSRIRNPLARDGIPGCRSLKQKRKLFPGFSAASPVCVALPRPYIRRIVNTDVAAARFWNQDQIPFRLD